MTRIDPTPIAVARGLTIPTMEVRWSAVLANEQRAGVHSSNTSGSAATHTNSVLVEHCLLLRVLPIGEELAEVKAELSDGVRHRTLVPPTVMQLEMLDSGHCLHLRVHDGIVDFLVLTILWDSRILRSNGSGDLGRASLCNSSIADTPARASILYARTPVIAQAGFRAGQVDPPDLRIL